MSPCYFLSSRGQKIKSVTKSEQKKLFVYIFGFIFMAFLAQELIYTVSIRLVNETRMILLVQAGTQANQFASTIDCTGNINKFYQKSLRQNFLFFLKTQRRLFLKTLSVLRKGIIRKIFHLWKEDKYVFIKGIIGKMNCYWHKCFSFDLCVIIS